MQASGYTSAKRGYSFGVRLALCAGLLAAIDSAAATAHAAASDEGPNVATPGDAHHEPKPVNIGVLAGYGLGVGNGTLTTANPYSVGFGLQADYQHSSGFVLGIGGDFFLGQAQAATIDAQGVPQPAKSARYVLAHARLGYNISMQALGSRLDVRPSVWIGTALGVVSSDPRIVNGTEPAFLLAPGISVHYLLGEAMYVGEDIRLSLPLGQYVKSAILILFTLGTHV